MKRIGRLHVLTDEVLQSTFSHIELTRLAIKGGADAIQFRQKDGSTRQMIETGRRMRRICSDAGVTFIVNDRIDVAIAAEADGVHLGQDDLPIAEARKLAPDLIIGGSSHSLDEALEVQAAGASYVNIGPLFPAKTKAWQGEFLGIDGLKAIAPHLSIPFTVMGGIKPEHIPALCAAGARTIAVVTAVTAAPEPGQAARELLGMMG